MSTGLGIFTTDNECCTVPAHGGGAVIAIGPDGTVQGVTQADTRITGNYARLLQERFDGFYWDALEGKTGTEATPILAKIVAECGTEPDPSYWKATPGNVGRAAARFLLWSLLHPDAVWSVWP
jgi:hypothetical protein